MGAIPILIIENNDSHLKLEKLALADDNYEIRSTTNAKETMEMLKEFHPHLILMAIELPEMSGLELTKILKASPKYRDIKIVAVTAYGMEEDKERAIEAGFNGYIIKPIDIETFGQTIASFLTRVP